MIQANGCVSGSIFGQLTRLMRCYRPIVMRLIAIGRTTHQTQPNANHKVTLMRSLLKILLLAIALGSPLMVQAESPHRAPIVLADGGCKSLNEAVEQVRRQYKNGRIISAETRVSGGREVHHIRVMVDGTVKTVKVNGRKRG